MGMRTSHKCYTLVVTYFLGPLAETLDVLMVAQYEDHVASKVLVRVLTQRLMHSTSDPSSQCYVPEPQ